VEMNEVVKPWLPDPAGDAIYKDYHMPFGFDPKYVVDERTAKAVEDESIWADDDSELGLDTANTRPKPQTPPAAPNASAPGGTTATTSTAPPSSAPPSSPPKS